MADYEIQVDVGPDASGFHRELERELDSAARRADAVQVEVEPEVGREFRRQAKRDVARALADLDAAVQLNPEVARSFRRDVQKLVKEATAGRPVEVPLEATLGRGFRRELQKQVTAATTAGNGVQVPVGPKLANGFRRDLQKLLTARFGAKPPTIPLAPQVSSRAMTQFTRELQTKTREAAKAVEASGAADIRPAADMDKYAREVKAGAAAAAAAADTTLDVDADTTKAQRGVGRLASKIKTALLPVLLGVAALTVGLGAAFGAAVGVTANFEGQLSSLQAVAGLTADQMAELRDQAIQAGLDTAFSAREAAEGQTELAKAGATVEQILGGGLDSALALASAGEIELGDAAEYVATGLNTFSLDADEASRVADTLAAAANKSAADIPDMGLAMSQAGLVASSLGLSIEDTSGALALFAQNGLRGSDAGTSFKTMLLRLNPSSKEAAELMNDLGLSAYDSQGQFVGLEQYAGQLQEALGGMTEEQRNAALQTLFGTDAVRAANLIYKAGPEGIREWTDSVTDAGFAADVAATKLDNLKGDLQILKGSFETAFIEAGTGQQAPLRELVQSLIPLVNEVGPKIAALLVPLGEVIRTLAPAIAPLTDALLPVLTTFAELLEPIAGALSELGVAALEGLEPLLAGLKPVAEAGALVIEAFAPLLPVLGELAGEILTALAPAFEALADPELVDALADLAISSAAILVAVAPLLPLLVQLAVPIATLLAKVAAFEPLLGAVVAGLVAYQVATKAAAIATTLFSRASAGFALNPIGLAVAAIVALGAGVYLAYQRIEPFRNAVDAVGRFFRDTLVPAVVDAGKAVGRWLVDAFDKARDVFDAVYPTAKKLFSIFLRLQVGPLLKFAKALGKLFSGDFSGFVDGLKDAVLEAPRALGDLVELVGPAIGKVADWLLTDGLPLLGRKVGELWVGLWKFALDAFPKVVGFLLQLIGQIGTWLVTEAVPAIAGKAAELTGAFLGWLVQSIVKLPLMLAEFGLNLIAWIIGTPIWLAYELAKLVPVFLEWIGKATTELPLKLAEVALAIVSWIGETAPEVGSKALELATSFLGWAADVATQLPGKLAEIGASIVTWIGELPGKIIEVIPEIVEAAAGIGRGILEGIGDGITAAVDFIGDVAGSIWTAVKDFINENVIDPIREYSVKIDPPGPGVLYEGEPFGSFPRLAAGGIITSPTLALVGEAGPELVLPLTDRKRMLELLRQAGAAPALESLAVQAAGGSPGAAQRAAGGALGAGGDVLGEPDGLQTWVDASVSLLGDLPGRVTDATVPGLTEWQQALEALLGQVGADVMATTDATHADLYQWAIYDVPTATLPALATWRAAVNLQLLTWQADTTAITRGSATAMADAWRAGLIAMETASGTVGDRIVNALVGKLEDGSTRIMGVVTDYRNDLADALNPILGAVGEPQLRFAAGGEVQRYAQGGYVPGPDVRRDVVPALLMPGEVVIRRASVERFGLGNMLRLNEGRTPPGWTVPRYAEGGLVTGDTEGLNPELHRRLAMWSAAVGQTYHVQSGYRSMQEQARLYAAYLAGTGNLAAPPGRSMHNFGLAADGNHWGARNPGAFGLAFTVPGEPWHVEPVEARQWVRGGAIPDGSAGGYGGIPGLVPFPEVPTDKLGKGYLADVAAAAMDFTRSGALEYAQGITFDQPGVLTPGGMGSAGQAAAAAWIRQAMQITGVGDDWFTGLLTIARRESNFDPAAVNRWDSNAARGTPSKGIMQMIDPTFRANALPGLGGIFDPVANIVAAIRYIQSRYGSIHNVQQANPAASPRGYELGGLVTADGTPRATAGYAWGDLAQLTRGATTLELAAAELRRAGSRESAGQTPYVGGDVNLNVTPPNSHDPESYAAALGHRAVPILAALARRT